MPEALFIISICVVAWFVVHRLCNRKRKREDISHDYLLKRSDFKVAPKPMEEVLSEEVRTFPPRGLTTGLVLGTTAIALGQLKSKEQLPCELRDELRKAKEMQDDR